MDKTNRKGMIVILCLQAAVLLCAGIFFYYVAGQVRQTNEQRIGAMIRAYPQDETQILGILDDAGGQDGRQQEQEQQEQEQRDAGRRVLEKYGKDGLLHQEKQLLIAGGTVTGALLLAQTGLLVWIKRRRDRYVLRMEKESGRCREEIKELQTRYEVMNTRLEKEERSTKSLITDISHQLKTPIASLKMSHELAGSSELTAEERQEFRQQETEELEKLETLLQSLMNLSKLETRMIQIRPVKSNIQDTIRGAISSVYMRAAEKQIDIAAGSIPDLEIPHDPKWTEEALVNVLDNGIKYSPQHSHIRIRAEKLTSYLLLEIEDQGIGIPQEERHKVFQRFYRGEQAKELAAEGSGVGLYLARRIIAEQGGTISVKSRHDRGSCGSVFQITLPLQSGVSPTNDLDPYKTVM